MNPETADDRRNMVLDFGEVCTVSPVAGGDRFAINALFNNGPRRVDGLDLDQYTNTSVIGTDPHLELPKEVASKISPRDQIEIPSELPKTYRVSSIEPEDIDGGFVVVQLLEA